LHQGAIAFEVGWDLARLVAHINEHVFFWPGGLRGPIGAGLRHYEHYHSEGPVMLRVNTRCRLALNPDLVPLFSKHNSGAPRVVAGRRSPRGSRSYLTSGEFVGSVSDVVEVAFRGPVAVPDDTEFLESYSGPWGPVRAGLE